MLNHNDKIEILKSYLSEENYNYADSFKTDILLHFNEFDNTQENNIRLNFLKNLKSKEDIRNCIDNLTSKIVMKYNEDEEQLSDFIFYHFQSIC